jgi:hypothetical protein
LGIVAVGDSLGKALDDGAWVEGHHRRQAGEVVEGAGSEAIRGGRSSERRSWWKKRHTGRLLVSTERWPAWLKMGPR